MNTLLLNDTIEDIERGGRILAGGGLVAFPTETVYGLGADAFNADAVRRVYAAKGRPSDNPMIVHIQEPEEILRLTPRMTEPMRILAARFWPGPMTMIVPRLAAVPDATTGGLDTVGVRLPSDRTARRLIRAAGCPVAAPSANLSGRPSPTTCQHVLHDLTGKIDAVLCGEDCRFGIESSVIDLTGDVPTILRPGVITREMFSEALGMEVALDPTLLMRPQTILDPAAFLEQAPAEKEAPVTDKSGAVATDASASFASDPGFHPKAPGMKYKHYAPKAAMQILEGEPHAVHAALQQKAARLRAAGKKVVIVSFDETPEGELEAAHELFARLRDADAQGADIILASALPQEGVGFSVMNRMMKSAGYNIKKV